MSGVRIPAPLLFDSLEKFLLIEKIKTFILSNQLISSNEHIFAAVSGGVDSMVMLYCLNLLKKESNFNLSVIHVNHGVRPGDTDEDENLVREWCAGHDLPFHSKKLSGFDLISPENDLRDARYDVFNEILLQNPDAKVATAHTLDDQVETFLMRLAKGSKVKGLCGIPAMRDAFIRPMLNITKKELYQFAMDKKIPFHEDYTNKDEKKLRNKIRRQIVPGLIETFGENFYEGFRRSQQDLIDVWLNFMESMQQIYLKYVKEKDNGLEIQIEDYRSLSLPERRQLLNGCVSKFYPLNFQIRSTYFEQFDEFVHKASTGKQFHFENNLNCLKNRTSIYFTVDQNSASDLLELYPGRVVYIGRNKISLKKVENGDRTVDENSHIELICGDRIQIPLTVRNWNEGDFFYPLGMNKKQKLSDFFINQKIDRFRKVSIPLVANGMDIIWVAGMRLDDRYKLTKTCKSVYKLEMSGTF